MQATVKVKKLPDAPEPTRTYRSDLGINETRSRYSLFLKYYKEGKQRKESIDVIRDAGRV